MNASLYGAKLMRDLGAFDTAQVMDASEVDAPDLPVKNGGVLAVSQSGETKDVLRSVTRRPFPTGSELQLGEDGVFMIIGASTRLRDGINQHRPSSRRSPADSWESAAASRPSSRPTTR